MHKLGYREEMLQTRLIGNMTENKIFLKIYHIQKEKVMKKV